MLPLTETAYAKINLALHIRGRRIDGYHDIETLFVFVDNGDRLMLAEAEGDEPELELTGPFAAELEGLDDNLVLQVTHDFLEETRLAGADLFTPSFRLEKNLPVASGIGGGSADAAAAARLLSRAFRLFDADELCGRYAALGSDIPACIESRTRLGRGTGIELSDLTTNDLQGAGILLVNPKISVPTGPVFSAWDGVDRGALPDGSALEIALNGRNDLEEAAIRICPVILDILNLLANTRPLLARMSGSGATCFALYDSEERRDAAQAAINALQPDWWTMTGKLR